MWELRTSSPPRKPIGLVQTFTFIKFFPKARILTQSVLPECLIPSFSQECVHQSRNTRNHWELNFISFKFWSNMWLFHSCKRYSENKLGFPAFGTHSCLVNRLGRGVLGGRISCHSSTLCLAFRRRSPSQSVAHNNDWKCKSWKQKQIFKMPRFF